jgi:hypothetical protein
MCNREKETPGSVTSGSDETSLIQVDDQQGWSLSRLCCLVSHFIASGDQHTRLPIHGHPQRTLTIQSAYNRRTPLQEPEITHLSHTPHTRALHKLQLRSCSNQHCTQPTPLHWQDRSRSIMLSPETCNSTVRSQGTCLLQSGNGVAPLACIDLR